jgi:hypothetical protein
MRVHFLAILFLFSLGASWQVMFHIIMLQPKQIMRAANDENCKRFIEWIKFWPTLVCKYLCASSNLAETFVVNETQLPVNFKGVEPVMSTHSVGSALPVCRMCNSMIFYRLHQDTSYRLLLNVNKALCAATCVIVCDKLEVISTRHRKVSNSGA